MRSGVGNQSVCQHLPLGCGESKTGEELRLAASFRVIECEEVVNDFASLDIGVNCVRKIHRQSCCATKLGAFFGITFGCLCFWATH